MEMTNWFLIAETLRALYLGDNDFEFLPPEIAMLKNLQIVSHSADWWETIDFFIVIRLNIPARFKGKRLDWTPKGNWRTCEN